jgi:selenocysteine lyase/cysteine desulfurase
MQDQRSYFHLPEATYLNCAYMAPLLKEVEESGIRAIRQRRNPANIQPENFFTETEAIRELFASLIHAEASRIVLIPSVSYGMANVVNNVSLSGNQNLVLAAEQFPSNYYPWKRLADTSGAMIKMIQPDPSSLSRGRDWNNRILESIDSDTGLVALSPVHWADGTRFDLQRIRERSAEVGAFLIIDGTQSIGAFPFDIREIKPDALVCAGYKWLMGPYSLGLAYYGPRFDGGRPIEENWINRKNSEDFTGLVRYEEEYQPGSLRYEVGEHSNFTLVPMLHAALKQIVAWQPSLIQKYCASISKTSIERIKDMGYIIEEDAYRASHLFGIRIPEKVDGTSLKAQLIEEKVIVSFRGDAIRISPNVYNTEEDLLKLSGILERALVGSISIK